MQNKKQYKLELDNQGIQLLEAMINEFPLGKVNVKEASASAKYAQDIMDFVGKNITEVLEEEKPKPIGGGGGGGAPKPVIEPTPTIP